MRRIAIINQKGGVGKTTTAVNLSAALARLGHAVGILDLDPQAHATTHLGIEPDGDRPSMYDVLVRGRPLVDVRRDVGERLSLVGSDINLAAAEVELAGVVGRKVILREAPSADVEKHDYIVMDCGPSLGVLTLNALAATEEVFIPLSAAFFRPARLEQVAGNDDSRQPADQSEITGQRHHCLPIRIGHEAGKQKVMRDLNTFLEQSRGKDVPWANAAVFESRIRRNIKLAECPSHGKTIFEYAPACPGAADYMALRRGRRREGRWGAMDRAAWRGAGRGTGLIAGNHAWRVACPSPKGDC